MIARVWRGVAAAADADRYLDDLHQTGVPGYQATPGNRGVSILRRITAQGVECTTLTFWDSMESIKAFAGNDPSVAHYDPADDDVLLFREPVVDHFDVAFTKLPFGEATA